jgi:hypothetical protein
MFLLHSAARVMSVSPHDASQMLQRFEVIMGRGRKHSDVDVPAAAKGATRNWDG